MQDPIDFFPVFFQALFAIEFPKLGMNLLNLSELNLQHRKPQPQAFNTDLLVGPFIDYQLALELGPKLA